jgi:Thioesterase-like superfamily
MPESVFVREGDRFVATELARGPWDPEAQHGGAPAALLVRAFEQLGVPGELMLARATYEFLRPVPLAALSVSASVMRSGRRVALVEGSISADEGLEVVRARGLYVRRTDVSGSVASRLPVGPLEGVPNDLRSDAEHPTFATDAMDIRFVEGKFWELGPATAWFRLRVPLVAGERPSGLQRLAAAADFGNGISPVVPWKDHLFINPDLSFYLEREPAGEWVCLSSQTRVVSGGVGVAESVLYDDDGRVGRAVQALVVERRG